MSGIRVDSHSPQFWIVVGQGPIALAVGAGGGCLDIFTLLYPFFSSFSLSPGDDPIQTEQKYVHEVLVNRLEV